MGKIYFIVAVLLLTTIATGNGLQPPGWGEQGPPAISKDPGNLKTTYTSNRLRSEIDIEEKIRLETHGYSMMDTKVMGNYAYCVGEDGLTILDVSDPFAPTLVSTMSGSFGRDAGDKLAVANGVAYLRAAGNNDIAIVDISNPAAPNKVGTIPSTARAMDIAIDGNVLYVCKGYKGMVLYDITSPLAPVELSVYGSTDQDTSFNGASRATVSAGRAYVTSHDDRRLEIVDVSDPAHPLGLKAWLRAEDVFPDHVAVSGNLIYITEWYTAWLGDHNKWYSQLAILDVSDPMVPVLRGEFTSDIYVNDVAVIGQYAYLMPSGRGSVQILDCSNPTPIPKEPVKVGELSTAGRAIQMTIVGTQGYISDYGRGLQVVDLSLPTSPVKVGEYRLSDRPRKVSAVGDYGYVSKGFEGIQIIDIRKPAESALVGQCAVPHEALDIKISGNFGYVAGSDSGIQIIDISNPTAPYLVGSLQLNGASVAIDVQGTFAYVADAVQGLVIVDVSNPASPGLVARLPLGGLCKDVAVRDTVAIVADSLGLAIVGIADPSNPRLLASLPYVTWPPGALFIQMDSIYCYSYSSGDGFFVYDVTNPAAPTVISQFQSGGSLSATRIGSYLFKGFSCGVQCYDVSDMADPIEVSGQGTFWNCAEPISQVASTGNQLLATSYNSLVTYTVRSCCAEFGTTGNVNDIGLVDLTDLSYLVAHLTGDTNGQYLSCHPAANVNGVGVIDLADLSMLVSYLTTGQPRLPICR